MPGVGSARSAMDGLGGSADVLRERHAAGRAILGICLGLQLTLDETEEDGGVAGLALVPGRAVRLREGRIPRIGWAAVEPTMAGNAAGRAAGARPTHPVAIGADRTAYWFAHSYVAETPTATATSEGLAAMVEHGSFIGVQFHPEKSGPAGARFLANVLDRCLSRV
jgi:imidazole glycerol phosphate synthase glutamine amidotransferase subunit